MAKSKGVSPAKTKRRGASCPVIVGIGASAGGLEALDQFFRKVPVRCGLAFVVVQHLDPTRKDMLTELLQRCTVLKVIQAKDRMKVLPNWVYVIPPNKDMSVLHGVLHLLDPVEERGHRLPIDFFFHSLAQDQGGRSVGVILSGMGSDGTQGVKAIKEEAGLVLAQDPASAKFDGMPRSVVDSGLADIVASAEDLPAKLLEYLRHAPLFKPTTPPLEESGSKSQLEKALILLRSQTGHDFSLYKKNTLYRRIERRMALHHVSQISTYVRYLRENPQELNLLFKELLIGVTSFFRDPAEWELLRDEVLPPMLAKREGRTLRAWVTGCSTGEEAFSLAMVFSEAVERFKTKGDIGLQIFATDLDEDALCRARKGLFSESVMTMVSPERRSRFFTEEEHGYRVCRRIREMVIFASQNVLMHPPFTKLDILSCRNLLIYLEPELQMKLFPLFHYSLNPGGVLFLGSAESVGNFGALFKTIGGKSRIFHRKEAVRFDRMMDFPSAFAKITPKVPASRKIPEATHDNLQALAEGWLLRNHTTPAVLVNEEGDILFTSGRTGRYLEPAAGKANWNVFAMARGVMRHELVSLFQKAVMGKTPMTSGRLRVGENGATHFVAVTVHPLRETGALRSLIMILFAEVSGLETEERMAEPGRKNTRVRELEEELLHARSDMQGAQEEMQTTQEELKSTNEELQSANEELQSTNEELTTSKEELQSLNEELQTVNAELEGKVEELTAASTDMKNLLNSTEIATVFLDSALHVRRFTEQATRVIKLIPSDVGRPVTDLASDLLYAGLPEDAREVLRTLVRVEKELETRDGRWFAMRLMPYRTMDNRIDGVVITFADITKAKKLEAELRASRKK